MWHGKPLLHLLWIAGPVVLGAAGAVGEQEYFGAKSGWTSAGVLALLLWWFLFKRLPAEDKKQAAKDAQILAIIEANSKNAENRDRRFETMVDAKDAKIQALIETNSKIIEVKDKQIQTIIDTHTKLVENKDLQIRTFMDARDQLVRDIAKNHDEAFAVAEKDRRADFQASLRTVSEHNDRQIEMLRTTIEKVEAESSTASIDTRRVLEEFRDSLIQMQINDSHKKDKSSR